MLYICAAIKKKESCKLNVKSIMEKSVSKELRWLDRNFVIRYHLKGESEVLISASKLYFLLGAKFSKVLNKVKESNAQNLTIKPFFGETYTFIYR